MGEETKARETAKSIALSEPVKFGGETYREIAVKEPNGGQVSEFVRKMSMETAWDAGLHLVCLTSGIPLGALKLMPATELEEAIGFVMGFIGGGKATGSP